MIDAATLERYMRDANPLPNLDDINADEFARFVAAAHPRRAVIMQAPTQHPTEPTPTTPKRRSRRVWAFAAAFIIVLVGVGLAALLLSSEEQPVVDEPPFDIESLRWTRVPHNPAVFGGGQDGSDRSHAPRRSTWCGARSSQSVPRLAQPLDSQFRLHRWQRAASRDQQCPTAEPTDPSPSPLADGFSTWERALRGASCLFADWQPLLRD